MKKSGLTVAIPLALASLNHSNGDAVRFICATLLRHSHMNQQKSHLKRWLNYMILKLKFGGPCWV